MEGVVRVPEPEPEPDGVAWEVDMGKRDDWIRAGACSERRSLVGECGREEDGHDERQTA